MNAAQEAGGISSAGYSAPIRNALGEANATIAFNALCHIAGWILIAVLVVGSAAMGLRPWPLLWAGTAGMLVAMALWLPSSGHTWHRAGGRLIWIMSEVILAYCLASLCNARSTFSETRGRIERLDSLPWLPGVGDVWNALPGVCVIVVSLGVMIMAADIGRGFRWRGRLLASLAVGGLMTAIVGLLEEIGVLEGLRQWIRSSPWSDARPFGFFSYHNNAATMMNLAMPAIASLGLRGTHRLRRKVVASGCIALIACASTANISRTGLVIAVVMAAASLGMLWLKPLAIAKVRWKTIAGAAVVAATAIIFVAALLFVVRPPVTERFLNLDERWATYEPRRLQAVGALELVERAPIFGHGVGAYRLLISSTSIGNMYLAPRYRPGDPYTSTLTASNDYLQTLVEWGGVGTVLWAALVLVAGGRLGFVIYSRRGQASRREAILLGLSLSAVFGHAVVDSPLQTPSLQFVTAALLGLAWGAPHWRAHSRDIVAALESSANDEGPSRRPRLSATPRSDMGRG